MNKDEFYKEIELEYEDVKSQFLHSYAHGCVHEKVDDPLDYALGMLEDEWDLEDVPEEAVTPWLEDTEALTIAKGRALFERRRMNAIDSFKRKRLAGATFAQASKAAGEKPEYMT